jgi:hypothetical protein
MSNFLREAKGHRAPHFRGVSNAPAHTYLAFGKATEFPNMFEPVPWAPPKDAAARCLAETLVKVAELLDHAGRVAAAAGQAGVVKAIAAELHALAGKLDPIQFVDGAEPVPQLVRISAA